MFLIKSKLSITAYLFLALYESTALQSQSFLKNIESFLYRQKLLNNCIISSMHAERKITVCSHKHSFTPYPSLSPYSQTESQTESQIHSLHVGWRNLFHFQLCCYVSLLFWWEIGCGFTYYLCTQRTIQLCGCVSFFVVEGNSSQNENTFLQKKTYWVTLL